MKTNKLDNSIKNKLKDRTFEPSASAWERLSAQLDEQPKDKKRGWFFYIGYAASILLLVSIGIQLFSNTDDEFPTKDEIVLEQIDKDLIDKNLEKLKNEIPVEKAIVKNDAVEEQQEGSSIIKKNVSLIGVEKTKKPIFIKNQDKIIIAKTDFNKNINIITRKEESHKKETKTIIAKVKEKVPNVILKKEESLIKPKYKQDPKSAIKINSQDLLYAVTHSQKEVEAYYAKHNVSREDVLKTIKSELKKSNIKINPNTILAEVERTIGEEDFQNKFMKSLKRRVSDIATAIASRND